jgi:hypothetical protein
VTCSGNSNTCVDGAYCYCGSLGRACGGIDGQCCNGGCINTVEVCGTSSGVIGH